MPALTTTFIAAAAASVLIYNLLFSSKDDDNTSRSASPSSGTTPLPPYSSPPFPSSSRSQTTGTPANADHNCGLYYCGCTPRAGDSRRTPSTATYARPSYQQPVTNSRTQASQRNFGTVYQDRDEDRFHPTSASTGGTRQTFPTSAGTYSPYSVQPTSPRATRPAGAPTTADSGDGFRRIRFTPSYAEEPRQTVPTSARVQASYLAPPTSTSTGHPTWPHATHSRTRSSSSDSDYVHTSPPTSPGALHDSEFDAGPSVEGQDRASDLRLKAQRCNRDMREARDLARGAHRMRDYTTESMHRQDAMACESKMKRLNKTAASIIFKENNKARQGTTVDLHGLFVNEAEGDMVSFIVGLHSDGGVPKLRPALEDLCDERRLAHSLDPKNAGKLIVHLG
ncbi:hypothetical protein BC826DRAFT_998228 [Russula brevipes]|nr:hypothetical protein BC826DRAFT_998228 [Russula brevipes]